MEAYYSEKIIDFLKIRGFTYIHGIDENTSVFFNRDNGEFITHKVIQSILDNDGFKSNTEGGKE